MLEYIFFHKHLLEDFVMQLERHSIPCETRVDALGLVTALPDDLDETLLEQVDAIYEDLLEDTEKLLDTDETSGEMHSAAICITLKSGTTVEATIRPALLKRILTVVSYEELNELVEAVVDSVENPDPRRFCLRREQC